MAKKEIKWDKKRVDFVEMYNEFDDSDTLKEMLFTQKLQLEKLEKIRSNTSMLVWWLVAIPILLVIFVLLFGGFGSII
mgnify:CR=1 FL=1|jgi:hypothetical protein|tara:strand:- start:767 stop:1000 length:234 start_codon:yes stop_codon:yes gene_type:complete